MRLKTAATLAMLLAMSALNAFGEKVDLRGPTPEAGETVVNTIITDTDAGTLNMTTQGQVIVGQMEYDSTHVIEQTIIEVTDGSPTKVRTTYKQSKTVAKTTVFGKTQVQEDTDLESMVLTQTKTAEGWKNEVEFEDEELPQEAKDMIKGASYVDPRLAFPDKPVGVGDTWKIEDGDLQAFMAHSGIPGSNYEGEINFKMVELRKNDGKVIAVLDFKMDGTITMKMETDPDTKADISFTIKADGKIFRDLQNYTTAQEFEGDMDMKMEMIEGGQQAMKMTAKMPMKIKQSQERK